MFLSGSAQTPKYNSNSLIAFADPDRYDLLELLAAAVESSAATTELSFAASVSTVFLPTAARNARNELKPTALSALRRPAFVTKDEPS